MVVLVGAGRVLADSGGEEWRCDSTAACSFNGECASDHTTTAGEKGRRRCVCDAAWRGPTCSTLNLLPAVRGAGLNTSDNGGPEMSWGGTVVEGDDGRYVQHCAEARKCGVPHCTPPTTPPRVCLVVGGVLCGALPLTLRVVRSVSGRVPALPHTPQSPLFLLVIPHTSTHPDASGYRSSVLNGLHRPNRRGAFFEAFL